MSSGVVVVAAVVVVVVGALVVVLVVVVAILGCCVVVGVVGVWSGMGWLAGLILAFWSSSVANSATGSSVASFGMSY